MTNKRAISIIAFACRPLCTNGQTAALAGTEHVRARRVRNRFGQETNIEA